MDSNHQKRATATNEHEAGEVIRPAAFANKGKKRKEETWTEEDLKRESDSFKDQYVEEVALNATQAALRILASAGLCDLDGEDVPDILHMLQAIKAVGCKSIGIDHDFHPVTKKIMQEPDAKTRQFIGHMVMSADGSLQSSKRYFAEGD